MYLLLDRRSVDDQRAHFPLVPLIANGLGLEELLSSQAEIVPRASTIGLNPSWNCKMLSWPLTHRVSHSDRRDPPNFCFDVDERFEDMLKKEMTSFIVQNMFRTPYTLAYFVNDKFIVWLLHGHKMAFLILDIITAPHRLDSINLRPSVDTATQLS